MLREKLSSSGNNKRMKRYRPTTTAKCAVVIILNLVFDQKVKRNN